MEELQTVEASSNSVGTPVVGVAAVEGGVAEVEGAEHKHPRRRSLTVS